jgi:tyrosine-protein kinase Etk/Wzc
MDSNSDYNPSSQKYPPYINNDEGNDIDINRYLGLFLSNWYWFALALFISLIIAYGINTYSESEYTVSSSLLINEEQSNSDITGLDRILPRSDIFSNKQNLQNEIGILKSFNVSYRVMKEIPDFNLTIIGIGRRNIAQRRHYKSAPFIVVYDSINKQRIGAPINMKIISANTYSIEISGEVVKKKEYNFGERFNEGGFDFIIKKRDSTGFKYEPELSNRYIFYFNSAEDMANYYRNMLQIEPVKEDATLVTLSVSGVAPQQEADYLNKLMNVYIEQGLEFKNQTAEKTLEFINQQLKIVSDSLNLAEKALENFRLANKLIDLSQEGNAIKNKLDKYIQDKISTNLQLQYYEYLANYIKTKNESGEIVSPSVMGINDPMLMVLVEELSRLQTQKKQINYNISGNQPAISFIDGKIEDARNALFENVRGSITNIENVINDINQRLTAAEGELSKLPRTERNYINIQRRFDLNNTVYTYMLEKKSEAGIAKASKVSGNRIIDYAIPYNAVKIKPKGKKNFMLAIILGIMIPGLYIYLIDKLHNRILDKKDIEKGTSVPIIGFIGHNNFNSELPVTTNPGSALAESFRSIRTNLKYYLTGRNNAVISVTSTISGEGKTFFSLNLAVVLAMLGRGKILLIGIDLRKPRLDSILSEKGGIGLSSYLIGECEDAEIIKSTDIENLFFVPSGTIPPNPSELLESERMKQFMLKVKKEFDYIVLDTPPIGIVSDALLLGSYTDLNIFVIRQKFSFKSTLELIQNIFQRNELKNLTIAVNDIHVSGYYGYGLRYGYGFYEGYGYNYGYRQYGSYGQGDYHKYYTD